MHNLEAIDLKKGAALRLRRSAHALVRGREILVAILAMEDEIVAAAEQDIPPVSVISEQLFKRFGEHLKAVTVRQFIGTVVKAILADRGFEVAQTGIRLRNDPVFTTGAAYRKVADQEDGNGLVRRAFSNMIKGMSQEERKIMLEELRRAGGDN